MGKLSTIKRQIGVEGALPEGTLLAALSAADKQFHSSIANAVTPVSESVANIQKALTEQLKAVTEAQSDSNAKVAGRIEKTSGELVQAVAGLLDHISGMEASILAEIKAIHIPKVPKAEKVDMRPVMQAVEALEDSLSERISTIPKPEVPPEKKTQWTFDVVRNKTTGLIERIEAK